MNGNRERGPRWPLSCLGFGRVLRVCQTNGPVDPTIVVSSLSHNNGLFALPGTCVEFPYMIYMHFFTLVQKVKLGQKMVGRESPRSCAVFMDPV